MRVVSDGLWRGLRTSILGGLLVGVLAVGRPSTADGQPAPPVKADDKKPEDKMSKKDYEFKSAEMPWKDALDWVRDLSGKPFILNDNKPTGSFSFNGPKGVKYSVRDIIDILNEALLVQKMYLVDRGATFTIIAADQKPDPANVPLIKLEELDQRGRTELVRVQMDLKSLDAETAAASIEKIMGPFGNAVPFGGVNANKLMLTDTVATLRFVRDVINESDKPGGVEAPDRGSLTYECQYIKARDAERILKEAMGDPTKILGPQPTGPAPGSGGDRGDRGAPPGAPGGPGGAPARSTTPTPKFRFFSITSDDNTNTVVVTGPADKLAQAKQILERLDKGLPGQPRVIIGPPILHSYPVTATPAADVAKTLREGYAKNAPNIRIETAGTNAVLVYAPPADQISIAAMIIGIDKPIKSELLPVGGDADKVATTLKAMFTDKSGGPFIEAQPDSNAVLVKGTAAQVDEIKAAIRALSAGGGPEGFTGTMRTIDLGGKGSASALAAELETLLKGIRSNPVEVVNPSAVKLPTPVPPPAPPAPPTAPPMDKPQARLPQKADTQFVNQPLVDPKDDPKNQPARGLPGDPKKPLKILAFGNRLIMTCDDPQELALAYQIVKLYLTSPGEGDFEVITLKNANAAEAAKVLDETYNGQRTPAPGAGGGGGGRGGFGGFGGGFGGGNPAVPAGPAAPAAARVERVRVVADPGTNSLLVKATPLDMLSVRKLIGEIDRGTDSKAVLKSWIIGPLKYATAVEVAKTLGDVYREQTNQSPRNSSFTSLQTPVVSAFSARGGNQPVDAAGNPKAVVLSIGIDDRTNSLVLQCTEAMYEDIKKLVTAIEEKSKDFPRSVQFVALPGGVDPNLIEQAIDAIEGRQVRRPGTTGQGGQGQGMQGGFGGNNGNRNGGGNPGGGGGLFPGGGGGNPGGGGGFPGGGGGGNPGGGGGRQSGGGGGGGRPPGRSDSPISAEGRDFFADRVMEDPQSNILYDPQLDTSTPNDNTQSNLMNPAAPAGATSREPARGTPVANEVVQLQPVAYQQPPPPPMQPVPPEGAGGVVVGPRQTVTAVALPEIGGVIVTTNNPEDMARVLAIIKIISEQSKNAEIGLELVPLTQADATSVANTLNQVFQRVNFNTNGNGTVLNRGTTTNINTPQGAVSASQQQAGAVALFPLPRFNAILVAAPRIRIRDVKDQIKLLDVPNKDTAQPTAFQLKKASATRVATLITNFYASRYPGDPPVAANAIKVFADDSSNTVFVQAAPADMAEISALIVRIDTTGSKKTNDLRIVLLQNATSDELAALLTKAIQEGVLPPSTPTGGGVVPGIPAAPAAAATGANASTGARPQGSGAAASFGIKFISGRGRPMESDLLEDVYINSYPRLNGLLISAPEKTMDLLLKLISELDVAPKAMAQINIFPLKNADATTMAGVLQQLFLSTSSTTGGAKPPTGPTGGTTGTTVPQALQISPGGVPVEGAPLIDIRIAADPGTNSIIAAGSKNDLLVIEAILGRIEAVQVDTRRNEVYLLHNATAVDLANALNTHLTNAIAITKGGPQYNAYQDILQEVIVTPEPITNKLLISATPRFFPEVMRLIHELDAESPQVFVACTIAEVDLSGNEEFGVELGLQSPVLFNRNTYPAPGYGGSFTSSFTNVTGSSIPPGVAVNSTINPASTIGYQFNQPTLFPGSNPVVQPATVGFQGLTSLGVGRVSPTSGIGGFVFSASSDSLSVLIRALKSQGRIDLLSRPQLMTLDNQNASILIGQSVPYITGSNVTATGLLTNSITYRDVGVQLNVTPKITPDNRVIMRVVPEISSVENTQISIGNGTTAAAFNVQNLATTVIAADGETIVIGGMISRATTKTENKVPWLGDLPYVGAAFRYRSDLKAKVELIIILTPRIVRCRAEAERVLVDEAKKMDYVVGDIIKTHGPVGVKPLLEAAQGGGAIDGNMPSAFQPIPVSGPVAPQGAVPPQQTLPNPNPSPTPMPSGQSTIPLPQPRPQHAQPLTDLQPAGPGQAIVQPATPMAPPVPATFNNGPVSNTPAQVPVRLPSLAPLTTPSGVVNPGMIAPMMSAQPQGSVPMGQPMVPPGSAMMINPNPMPALQQQTDYTAVPPGVRVNVMNNQGQAR